MSEKLWVRWPGVDDSGLCLQGPFHLPLELAALSGAQVSARGARTRAEVRAEGESRFRRHQGEESGRVQHWTRCRRGRGSAGRVCIS